MSEQFNVQTLSCPQFAAIAQTLFQTDEHIITGWQITSDDSTFLLLYFASVLGVSYGNEEM
jgi:hypothetical protein